MGRQNSRAKLDDDIAGSAGQALIDAPNTAAGGNSTTNGQDPETEFWGGERQEPEVGFIALTLNLVLCGLGAGTGISISVFL